MTKSFYCGDYAITGYYVKAGTGWEIGYKFGNKTYFVSNFVNQTEAAKWWTLSQKFMTSFCKNDVYPNMNKAFFGSFFGNYLYTQYYSFLKGIIAKNYTYSQKFYKKDFAQYKKYQSTYAA